MLLLLSKMFYLLKIGIMWLRVAGKRGRQWHNSGKAPTSGFLSFATERSNNRYHNGNNNGSVILLLTPRPRVEPECHQNLNSETASQRIIWNFLQTTIARHLARFFSLFCSLSMFFAVEFECRCVGVKCFRFCHLLDTPRLFYWNSLEICQNKDESS